MKSVMNASLRQATVPDIDIPRSSFDMSHGLKTTFDASYLIPIYLQEVIPGDTHNVNCKALIRMSTPLYPLMDNLHADFFFFFVPHRIVWTNFTKMMGEQDNPTDSVDFTIPQLTADTHAEGDLYDHLGVPPGYLVAHSNIPARGHNKIYNDWFRDQNLQNSVVVDVDDGPDAKADYVLLKRGKRHDYFTSCLPWTQKTGATEVLMPLGTTAPVIADGTTQPQVTDGTNVRGLDYNSGSTNLGLTSSVGVNANIYWETTGMSADLASASAATVNQFRYAIAVQTLYERDARGGTRYPEIIFSHFGVSNAGGDARLQRAEYLGGGSYPITTTPLALTTTLGGVPGDLAGITSAFVSGTGFVKSFTEHGYIHGFVSVRGDITYQRGLQRHWYRQDKLDFYWPSLSQIGEMAVYNRELYLQADSTDTGATGTPDNERVFGYQERDADLRYKPSEIHATFRSTAATPLDAWHVSEEFTSLPTLGPTFIVDNTPVDRVVQVPAEPNFIGDFFFQQYSARPLPMYGVPATLGRF